MIMNMSAGANIQPVVGKLLSTLNVGDTLEVPVVSDWQDWPSRFGANIVWKVADKNHAGYPTDSVTLITDKIIQIMAWDAKEPRNSDSFRKDYGNSRHIHSNILQWLNSNATAGNWYSPKHSADQAPMDTYVTHNPYALWKGFLGILQIEFIDEILDTTLTVQKSATDGGGYETFTAKMFLASSAEVGLANSDGNGEGTLLALFSDDTSRVAYPTAECVSNSDGYSNSGFATSNGWSWWLRTPMTSCSAKYVDDDGSLGQTYVISGVTGVRPLCNLPGSLRVSESPNAAGNYTLLD